MTARQVLWIPEREPGLLLSLTVTNPTKEVLSLEVAWLVRFDLQGAWWSDWSDRADAAHFEEADGAIVAHDTLHQEWAAAMLGESEVQAHSTGPDLWAAERTGSLEGYRGLEQRGIIPNPAQLQGAGVSGQLQYEFALGPGNSRTLHFALAGGLQGAEFARHKAAQLLESRAELWAEKVRSQNSWFIRSAWLRSPRPDFDRIFDGSKLCLDMQTFEIPGLRRGIVGGLPGFAWFFGCDTYYTVSGLLISGQSETALENLRLLADYAGRQGGRVPHEITQTGRMFNAGNTIEAGQFVTAVERAFRWTGDRGFLAEMYDVCRAAIFDYMLGECDPRGDLLPDGPGLLELRSAEHGKKLDVACSLFQGLQSLAYLAGVQGDRATEERAGELVGRVQAQIERYFWSEARQEYLWRIEPDLSMQPNEPAHSYVGLEMGVVANRPERVKRLFERVEGPEHTGPRGLIHPGTTDFVMPIQNAIIALAEFRYGRPDRGLWYLERCAELYGYYTPWAIPEFVGPDACFLQAWSSATFNWLSVQGMFRLQPDPTTGVIFVQPQLPSAWDFLEVLNLNLWGRFYDLRLERVGPKVEFTASARTQPDLALPFEVMAEAGEVVSFV